MTVFAAPKGMSIWVITLLCNALRKRLESRKNMNIREATENDFEQTWPIFHEIVSVGDTYAYPQETTKNQALQIWLNAPRKTYVFEESSQILGRYYLKTNQAGPGNHVCNCGYMVSSTARGCGLATTMCEHSQKVSKELGYKAM